MALTLADLQAECDAMRGFDPSWYLKMMHRIPDAPVVDRVRYILAQCRGKRVLHLGCNWPPGALHQGIQQVAALVIGIDITVPEEQCDGPFQSYDLDMETQVARLPSTLHADRLELIVCAEILEHLGNPGNLLHHLTRFGCPVLITVPNAFSSASAYHISGGVEAVNPEHVAYYSYHTLKVLVERYGFRITEFCWYNGKPGAAEGLIFLVA